MPSNVTEGMGLARTGRAEGLGGLGAHSLFHLPTNVILTFPLVFLLSHMTPDCFLGATNIFPLAMQRNLALFCCSKLSYSKYIKMLEEQRVFQWLLRKVVKVINRKKEVFHYLFFQK